MAPKKIVIVGGGTAGWMSAAALAKFFPNQKIEVQLIESEAIGTVGVGEATIPHLRYFNQKLGFNEHEFMQRCQATYKLGIEFVNWGKLGDAYIHPFGDFGEKIHGTHFYRFWLDAKQRNPELSLFDYSLAVAAAKKNKFEYPAATQNPLSSSYSYAFHLDASLYAKFLTEFSQAQGVERKEGKIEQVLRCATTGNITALVLNSGETIAGDFFIDCSGFRSLLLGDALGVGYDNWSHWLPCDRAIAVPTENVGETRPYSRATAHPAGWQWNIPLRHRTGNGHVYASHFMDEDTAVQLFNDNLSGNKLANFNFIKFTPGRRQLSWSHNCLAIGLASGFLEPLESTSIYLIQLAIMKLIEFFPSSENYAPNRDEFNRQLALEYERIRDFLILHYHATERDDSDFWRYCRTMSVPESLTDRMNLFFETGHIDYYHQGLFLLPSWVAVLIGQGKMPAHHNLGLKTYSPAAIDATLAKVKSQVDYFSTGMRAHGDVLLANSAASDQPEMWPVAAMSLYGVFS